jgi:two-component system phosphate regulon response regulator PhoB
MRKDVLIVVNEAAVARMLEKGVRTAGFAVTLACNGEEGLWKAATMKPCAVILNARLPHASGWEICEAVNNNAATRGIPVIMLSERPDAYDRAKALMAGCAAHVTGPFDAAKCAVTAQILRRQCQAEAGEKDSMEG